ncbi:RNA pseudouridine synthase [Methylophaga sp. 41_12_T18]|nr:RNA pseudouridine synthase [Methylophaga sp. 41_12_T18]
MSETLQLDGQLPDDALGLRLDQALAQLFTDYSRGQLTKWIKAGYVSVNNHIVSRPRESVNGGEQIIITATIEAVDDSWVAEAIQLDIIHEDDDVMIINKPAGMVVHPGAGNHNGTLVNALLNHSAQLETIPRAGIVHRLDKGTTGLLMIAKTLQAHNSLVSQLQERTVLRQYQAIAVGVLTAGGTVDEPIGRHNIDRKRMAVTGSGKPSVTHYRVEQRFKAHTHIRCNLETGRTHQIRVHMAHIRHPLLGDSVYGGRFKFPKGVNEQTREAIKGFNRQALHAGLLGFIHPKTEQEVSWQVNMPDDMQAMLALLAQDTD